MFLFDSHWKNGAVLPHISSNKSVVLFFHFVLLLLLDLQQNICIFSMFSYHLFSARGPGRLYAFCLLFNWKGPVLCTRLIGDLDDALKTRTISGDMAKAASLTQ